MLCWLKEHNKHKAVVYEYCLAVQLPVIQFTEAMNELCDQYTLATPPWHSAMLGETSIKQLAIVTHVFKNHLSHSK